MSARVQCAACPEWVEVDDAEVLRARARVEAARRAMRASHVAAAVLVAAAAVLATLAVLPPTHRLSYVIWVWSGLFAVLAAPMWLRMDLEPSRRDIRVADAVLPPEELVP